MAYSRGGQSAESSTRLNSDDALRSHCVFRHTSPLKSQVSKRSGVIVMSYVKAPSVCRLSRSLNYITWHYFLNDTLSRNGEEKKLVKHAKWHAKAKICRDKTRFRHWNVTHSRPGWGNVLKTVFGSSFSSIWAFTYFWDVFVKVWSTTIFIFR